MSAVTLVMNVTTEEVVGIDAKHLLPQDVIAICMSLMKRNMR